MTTTSSDVRERTPLDLTHEDLRPMSLGEFQAVLWMVTAALTAYAVVMALFVP